MTLNACSKACTTNDKVPRSTRFFSFFDLQKLESFQSVACESFEYDPRGQECLLHASSGQPFGGGALSGAERSRAFFQQICLPGGSEVTFFSL